MVDGQEMKLEKDPLNITSLLNYAKKQTLLLTFETHFFHVLKKGRVRGQNSGWFYRYKITLLWQ